MLGQQQVQENAYEFPYHYIVQYKNEFSLIYIRLGDKLCIRNRISFEEDC